MTILQRMFLVLLCVSLLSGCYEDEAELTINSDGSGTIKQRLVFSERFMVASEGKSGPQGGPVPDKDAIVEQIGSAVEIKSIKQTDLTDGKRLIEIEGTFSTPEQFFLSEYCEKQFKLRISPAGEGKAAIACDMEQSDSGRSNLERLYGLAKGLYVKRTVHLPAEVEKTNGHLSETKTRVSWIMDLRDKHGLAEAKMFIEGPEKGRGSAVFNVSELKFSLPLKVAGLTEETAETGKDGLRKEPAGLAAEISWISVMKSKKPDGSDIAEKSYMEIGVELSWNEGHRPVRHNKPVLLSLLDDRDNDLITSDGPSVFQGKIYEYQKKKRFTLRAKAPAKSATKLKALQGYVEVIADAVEKVVVLENIQELVGKETTGNPVLDKLNFKIKGIEGHTLKIEIDGGNDTLISLNMVKEDGSKVKKGGHTGWGNEYSYDFSEDISKLTKCELEVVVSESTVKVPFSLKEISLP